MKLRNSQIKVLVLAIVAVIPKSAKAIPVPILDVPALVAGSDLVVTGKVTSIREDGTTVVNRVGDAVPARFAVCEVEVDKILKGTIEGTTILFRYVLPSEPIGYASVVLGYQILFLKKRNSEYSLTSPYYASLPSVPGPAAVSGDALRQVTALLGALLESPSVPAGQKQTALHALSTIPTSASTELLRKTLSEANTALRLGAAGFLLLRGDISGMEIAERALTHPEGLPPYAAHNLDYAIGEGVRNETAVPALARLARLPELETRQAAASALRHTASKTALKALVFLLVVRHEAIMGLAEITGQSDWSPNLELFRSQEERHVSHWRDWASANLVTE